MRRNDWLGAELSWDFVRSRKPTLATAYFRPTRFASGRCPWRITILPRILKVAVAIRPSTLLRFHRALVRRKYQWLFSSKIGRRPGPKGPSKELIAAILEIKRLNPRFGCPRIAQRISHAFGLEIDKDVVRRILANHHFPKPRGEG